MNWFAWIYTEILYKPLFNAMVFLYNLIPWEGWALAFAIIVLTLLIKLALYTMSSRSIVAQREMQELQPKLNDIQEKYKKDKSFFFLSPAVNSIADFDGFISRFYAWNQ